jgi:hypothetical protein
MPNTNRIQRDGDTSTIATQPQKTDSARQLVIAHSNGKRLVRVADFPITIETWTAACRRDIELRKHGRSFFAEAIRDGLNDNLMTLADRLDHAVRKMEILDSFILNDEASLEHLDKAEREKIEFGKTLLTRGVVQELSKCRDDIMSAAYSKPEVAA